MIASVLKFPFRARNLALLLAMASGLSVVATYYAISSNDSFFGPDPRDVIGLILTDLILLLALVGVISRRLVRLVLERRQGIAGSRLQSRVVMSFLLIALVPTILMAVFSAVFFNFGIQSWFDTRVSNTVDGSIAIAKKYLEEHKNVIRADILGMAGDLNRSAHNFKPQKFNTNLTILAAARQVPEAVMFRYNEAHKRILASGGLSYALQFALEDLSPEYLQQAAEGEVVVITSNNEDRVMALVRLENFFDTYLLVGRFVDQEIINYIKRTEGAAQQYNSLKQDLSQVQIKFFIIFIIVSMLLLLVTIWGGMLFATDLVRPLGALVKATQRLKEGDFAVRVPEGPSGDEIATLARSFNVMAEQLQRQKDEIAAAQRKSAWSDVARRVAHEIKNPLTPIQLSAGRLKRKYAGQVSDSKTFEKYLETIIRNVEDIGRMVEEFSRFARTPAPKFEWHDLTKLVEEVVFERSYGTGQIGFSTDIPQEKIMFHCDSGQIVQVVTNLLKNAEESITERAEQEKKQYRGKIEVALRREKDYVAIDITDNGKGFPSHMKTRLTEPYVTTKSKGTGLGLAIVEKILADHHGEMEFLDADEGACVRIKLKGVAHG